MEVKDIIDLKTVKTNMNVNTKEEALKELAIFCLKMAIFQMKKVL